MEELAAKMKEIEKYYSECLWHPDEEECCWPKGGTETQCVILTKPDIKFWALECVSRHEFREVCVSDLLISLSGARVSQKDHRGLSSKTTVPFFDLRRQRMALFLLALKVDSINICFVIVNSAAIWESRRPSTSKLLQQTLLRPRLHLEL